MAGMAGMVGMEAGMTGIEAGIAIGRSTGREGLPNGLFSF